MSNKYSMHFIFILSLYGILSGCGMRVLAEVSQESIWIEAEDSTDFNWLPGPKVIVEKDGSGASGGLVLQLAWPDSVEGKKRLPYYVHYEVTTKEDKEYVLWLACTPANYAKGSVLEVTVDDQKPITLNGKRVGNTYAQGRFQWHKVGSFFLKSGTHTIRFEAKDYPKEADSYYAMIDALALVADSGFVPEGNHPPISTAESWDSIQKKYNIQEYTEVLLKRVYRRWMDHTTLEALGEKSAQEVTQKLMQRPLPSLESMGDPRFGITGMELPFVKESKNYAETQRAYELLARTGVNTILTAEAAWHRMGKKFDETREMDYQTSSAGRFGIKFSLILGYPPAEKNVVSDVRSTFKPEYEDEYRAYLKTVFSRYGHLLHYVQLANEVDAPDPWYKGGTPETYVKECRIIKEELKKAGLAIPLYAFGATYARDDSHKGSNEGQNFVRKCFELGINDIVDGYTIHYVWPLNQRGFEGFFQELMQKYPPVRPIVNNEEVGYGPPYTVVKAMARNLLLYNYETFNYYTAVDYNDDGFLISGGLFDADWNPKLRLLAYASGVDAIKHRDLVGMADLPDDLEAYILKRKKDAPAKPEYAVVLWRRGGPEEIGPYKVTPSTLSAVTVKGWEGVLKAVDWKLNPIAFDLKTSEFQVADEPIVIYAERAPSWKMMSRLDWLNSVKAVGVKTQAVVPGK
jgi:hypothetical protein